MFRLQEIVFSAFTGIIVGLACALPILIIATHNFFVGFLATLNIALVTATVLGFIPLMGWKIGVSHRHHPRLIPLMGWKIGVSHCHRSRNIDA